MSCVENITKFIVPNDVICSLCNIYKFIGKNDLYEEISKDDLKQIYNQTLEHDTYYLAKLIEIDVTDARQKIIINKNSEGRTRDEKVLVNIKEVLKTFQYQAKKQVITTSSILNLINYIYPNQNVKYDVIKEEKKNTYYKVTTGSKRTLIDDICSHLSRLENGSIEDLILTCSLIVDIYAIKPFTMYNDTITYILLYLMLLKSELYSIKYVSLFKEIYDNKKAFDSALTEACYNYQQGFPQTLTFIRFMMSSITKICITADKIVKNYQEEQNANKGDNIENTIMNLNNIFTKDEIRANHPYVSESTINRALTKLRDENIIRPLGKGRSAKWIKIGLR